MTAMQCEKLTIPSAGDPGPIINLSPSSDAGVYSYAKWCIREDQTVHAMTTPMAGQILSIAIKSMIHADARVVFVGPQVEDGPGFYWPTSPHTGTGFLVPSGSGRTFTFISVDGEWWLTSIYPPCDDLLEQEP